MLSSFLRLLYPSCCLSCQTALYEGEHLLCLHCQADLPRTQYHLDSDNPVAQKFLGRVPLKDASCFLHFVKAGKVQRIIHHLKYKQAPEVGELLGLWYGRELREASWHERYDYLVPVPLHPKKMRKRGYNQAACFGKGLSEALSVPQLAEAIQRVAATQTQTRKSRFDRWLNVEYSFGVQPKHYAILANKRILVVDDVITTGATTEACAQVLLAAGCSQVGVLAIANA